MGAGGGLPPRVLITGGCGFIGSNLIALLREREDVEIRVLDDESAAPASALAGYDVELVRGDVADPATVARALEGIGLVVHLAADTSVVGSVAAPGPNFRTNVVGTFNLLCGMRAAGVAALVNASTGGAILGAAPPPAREDVAAAPLSPYGASKLAAEGYCSAFAAAYGLAAASLRFANVYGPRSDRKGSVVAEFFRRIRAREELVVWGDGDQTRDYVFVDDLCEGILLAMKARPTGVFQLGTGVPTTLNALIARIEAVVGGAYPVAVRYRGPRPGEVLHTWCDIGKARRELGYDPTTPLEAGLRRTWEWFAGPGAGMDP